MTALNNTQLSKNKFVPRDSVIVNLQGVFTKNIPFSSSSNDLQILKRTEWAQALWPRLNPQVSWSNKRTVSCNTLKCAFSVSCISQVLRSLTSNFFHCLKHIKLGRFHFWCVGIWIPTNNKYIYVIVGISAVDIINNVNVLDLPMNRCVKETNVAIDFRAVFKGVNVGGIDRQGSSQFSCSKSITHC